MQPAFPTRIGMVKARYTCHTIHLGLATPSWWTGAITGEPNEIEATGWGKSQNSILSSICSHCAGTQAH